MKKKLVAVAVAAVLAAPLAAQAQTANVTLYGRVNVSVEYVDANGSNPGVARLSDNSSRFGLRGTEALGGGLNAIFQIESATSPDVGGNTLAGRNSYIGFQSGWGRVIFGRHDSPYDDMTAIMGTITLNTSILAMSSIWANNGNNTKAGGSFDARLGNLVRYDMPRTGGFDGAIAFSFDAENGATDPYVLSMSTTYRNGPFVGGAAFEMNDDVRGAGLSDWAATLTAGWDFGIVNVVGVYERLDYETPTGSLKRDFYGINMSGPAGPGRWQAFWMHADDGSGGGSTVGGLSSGNDTSADHFQVSYVYPLSKRTSTYIGWSYLDNDSRAGYDYGSNPYVRGGAGGVGRLTGTTLNGFIIGAWHNF